MKRTINFNMIWKRFLSVSLASLMLASCITIQPVSVSASPGSDYQVEIFESESNGFIHPGIGATKSILENMRTQVLAKKEPWYSYYQAMTVSSAASKTVTSSNASSSDPTKPASYAFNSQGFNSRFIQDGLKAYTQTLMYVVTGEEVYRKNAMDIIRIWSQMDPDQYEYFNDAHIHTGIPLNRMVTAAEILRYTSFQDKSLAWTEEDTANFTNNLINPVIETFQHDNNHFMNQHLYPLLGAMAGYIFTDNRERYDEAVEWATVNKTALNQGFNGSIKRLFRLVETNEATGEALDPPRVQHVEMGRDQAHGAGDLTNAAILARMFYAQGTKVDPIEGTVSGEDHAVGYYEFLDDRVLKAANYFWQFMLGYDTPWTPVAHSIFPDVEVKGIYYKISDLYKGRTNTALFWDMYYYYKYVRNMDVAEEAPYFYEAFVKRNPSNYYYQGNFTQAWESVDGGGDFWLYIPQEAEVEGTQYLPKEQNAAFVELEERYTAFDQNTLVAQDEGVSYVEFNPTSEGSKIAVHNLAFGNRSTSSLVGVKFRSNGPAVLELSTGFNAEPYHTLTLPDTQNEWRYMTFDMGISHVSYGQLHGDFSLVYMNVKGEGTTVGIDHFNVKAGEQLTPPIFNTGKSDLEVNVFVGAPLQLDFSATDSGSSDVLTYNMADLPNGASLNANTGEFLWQPLQSGNYSFVVEAFDGTTIETKNVTITVAVDRAAAVEAIRSLYDPNMLYETASLNYFNEVLSETENLLETANDEQFVEQLKSLKAAAENLQWLTPLLKDGSMDYSNIVTSTFGDSISLLVDDNDNSFPVYSLAPDLYHIVDFGPDYKVTAEAFGFEGRMNFDDRMAGTTVYASNDGVNWTRITPGQTAFTSEMSMIEVAEEYQNSQFRMFKIQMIDPQPDVLHGKVSNMLELSEFRIFGLRHETNNQLASVAISSEQGVKGRIVKGDNVKLTFEAKEEISDVRVMIQGQEVDTQTEDNINFTAVATMGDEATTGTITFSIDYLTHDGAAGDTAYFTTDGSKLFLADESDLIGDVLEIASLIDSTTGRSAADTLKQTGYLFDNDITTFSDYRFNGGGAGGYITFDFKEGNVVELSSIDLLARQDQYYTRIRGTVVQGSNDNATWTTISSPASSMEEWQQLKITDPGSYRYIRLYNSSAWFGNMAEVKLYGSVTSVSKLETVSISSEQGIRNRIVSGDTVKLSIKAKEAISDVQAMIQGQEAVVSTEDGVNYTATAVMEQGVSAGLVNFTINYKQQDGSDGFPITSTSDFSSLILVDEANVIENVTSISDLIDSTTGRTAADTLKQVNNLFDSNASTNSDFRAGSSSGSGSYIIFDFKEGNAVQLSNVELLARQDQYYTRIKGTVVQGSNDNTTWTNLTAPAASTMEWQTLSISESAPYRYIRIYNSGAWYGNMAELRLHKSEPVALENLTIAPETVSLKVGDTQALSVTANYSDETQTDVTAIASYSTSNEAVATVSEAGVVTAVATGTAVITVTYEGESETVDVTVTSVLEPEPEPVTLEGLTIAPDSVSLGVGSTQALSVTANYSDETQADVTPTASYSTSNEAVAAVNEAGVVTALSAGISVITATYEGESATVGVTVTSILEPEPGSVALENLTITPESVSLEVGETQALNVTANYSDETQADVTPTASYSTSNEAVATVNEAGVVTALSTGISVITATYEGESAKVGVTVALVLEPEPEPEPITLEGLTVTPESVLLKAGKTQTLTVTANYSDDTQADVTATASYTTSNEEVATVSEAGVVTAVSAGRVTITVTFEGRIETAEVAVIANTSGGNTDSSGSGNTSQPTEPVAPTEPTEPTQPETTKPEATKPEPSKPEAAAPAEPTPARPVFNDKVDQAFVRAMVERGQNAPAVSFNDVSRSSWSATVIERAARMGFVLGFTDGTFRPDASVTRAEFATMVAKAFGLTPTSNAVFLDTQEHWAAKEIAALKEQGILAGYSDGTFRPNQQITRAEMVAILARLTNYVPAESSPFSDIESSWAADAIDAFAVAGIVSGKEDGKFAPADAASRAEAVAIIVRLLDKLS
ncbi:S-layer homology domain-containing protein [Paenibacillus lentus]|uniref:S-layer homology domain-containing protein n=1 Tax=Paenibacillus lentus TaxID=1338368 RepID=UPI00365E00E7